MSEPVSVNIAPEFIINLPPKKEDIIPLPLHFLEQPRKASVPGYVSNIRSSGANEVLDFDHD